MNELNTVISLLNFVGLGGVGVFIYYLFKGLKERVANLSKLAEEQKQTLDAVRERAIEIDKLSQYYKQALEDFQDMGSKLENRRQELIRELEDAVKRKDEQLAELKRIELKETELKSQSLIRMDELKSQIQKTFEQLQNQIEIVTPQESIDKLIKISHKYENCPFDGHKNIDKATIIKQLTHKITNSMIDDKNKYFIFWYPTKNGKSDFDNYKQNK